MRSTTLFSSLLLTSAALLPAQAWPEAGDAGHLPTSAQVPVGNGSLTTITGSVGAFADLYVIQIDNPATFTASTVGGAAFDTQLFLFDQNGRGITGNDDTGVTLQSAIDGTLLPAPGRYHLAIAPFNNFPLGAGGYIWFGSSNAPVAPNGAHATEQLDGWVSPVVTPGNYSILLTGASFPQKRIVLPDNHHFSESQIQTGVTGTTGFWRAGGGRFQLLYEGSHFVNAGATGSITISRLTFRGEDGEVDLGGAQWNGATVRCAATSLTRATMSSTFASNLLAPATALGPLWSGNVTIRASQGSAPNNDNIVIDLGGNPFVFSPAGARPNLLIEVQLPNAATLQNGATEATRMQDTSGDPVTFVRGGGLTAATSNAATGALEQPLVMGVEFAGTGGNRVVVAARNEQFGAACGGSPSTFYQSFLFGQPVDLVGLVLTPDNLATPNYYTVTANGALPDVTKVNASPNNIGDDEMVVHPLGFQFRAPGVSTTSIAACTNGFLWLDGTVTDDDFTPTVAELLGGAAPRLLPFWADLVCGRNVVTHPNSGLHVRTDLSGGPGNAVCYVTWLDVAIYNGPAVSGTQTLTTQVVLHQATGVVEFRYSALPRFASSGPPVEPVNQLLVGWSRGQIGASPSVDPKSRDLSLELPFRTFVEGGSGNMGLRATAPVAGGAGYGARMFPGQAMSWNVDNVPAGSLLGVQLIDVAYSRPGFALPTITAPGCLLSTTANAVLWEVHLLPGASTNGTVTFMIPPGFDGVDVYAQYVVLGGLFGAPDLITVSSNAIRHTVGRR